MPDALSKLDGRIRSDLQSYLRKPVVERTQADYDALVDRLSYTSLDYAKTVVAERLAERRQVQQQVKRR